MNELRIMGRILSIIAGSSFYILVWDLIFENWDAYAKSLYDGWCWEKILGIFYRVWVWGAYYSGCRWINSLVYMELDLIAWYTRTVIEGGNDNEQG